MKKKRNKIKSIGWMRDPLSKKEINYFMCDDSPKIIITLSDNIPPMAYSPKELIKMLKAWEK